MNNIFTKWLKIFERAASDVATPAAGSVNMFVDSADETLKLKLSDGSTVVVGTGGGGTDVAYAVELDDAGGGVTYVGEADPGTATSDPNWRIKRITEVSGDIAIEWADGVAAFSKVWDDRAGYTYS